MGRKETPDRYGSHYEGAITLFRPICYGLTRLSRQISINRRVKTAGYYQQIDVRNSPGCELRVFRFGLLQDGNIRVGVFPESEELFIGCDGAETG